ncbi:protein kinase domain-containing protein [Nocardia takedensis]
MEDAESRVGGRFGPYELRSLLGRGGMGEVYEALDTVKGRVVALKLLPAELAADPTFQQRFRHESRATARLAEPHVIPIHDWGEIDGVLYIDMRFVRGSDLRSVLRGKGPLSPVRAVGIIEQVAAALDAAHAEGLVHRDVKPANILVTPSDFAYLADFGIARTVGDPNLTETGAAIGSYNYIAPERLDSAPIAGTADVYSLTCVLYECLTGAQPFPATAMSVLIRAHLTTPPPRPSAEQPGLPVALDAVVTRGMAKDPADRFQTAGALAAAARAALTAPAHGPTAPTTVAFPSLDPAPRRATHTGDASTTRFAGGQARGTPRPAPRDPRAGGPPSPPTVDLGGDAPRPGRAAESNPRLVGTGTPGPGRPQGRPARRLDAHGHPEDAPSASAPTVDLDAVGDGSPPPPPGAAATVDLQALADPAGRTRARPPETTKVDRTPPFAQGGSTAVQGNTGFGHDAAHAPGTTAFAAGDGGYPGRAHPQPPRRQAQARIVRPGAAVPAGLDAPVYRHDQTAVTLERSALASARPVRRGGNRAAWANRIAWVLVILILATVVTVLTLRMRDESSTPATQPVDTGIALPEGTRTCTQTEPILGRYRASAVGSKVTSCPFAEAVRTAYAEGGDGDTGEEREVGAISPINDREYTLLCVTGMDYVTCTGGENAVVYLY